MSTETTTPDNPPLITPEALDFPSWIHFDTAVDPDATREGLNEEAQTYYGDTPYHPVEEHLHWWSLPGNIMSHDEYIEFLQDRMDYSVNFAVSENRITLMVPLDQIAFATGKRNPFGWKVDADPTLTDQEYRTLGFLTYIVEKLNPHLLNEPLRLHKEFYSTSCSEIDINRVRAYADDFRTGRLDINNGTVWLSAPPIDTESISEPQANMVEIPEELYRIIKSLPGEFRALADDLDEYLV